MRVNTKTCTGAMHMVICQFSQHVPMHVPKTFVSLWRKTETRFIPCLALKPVGKKGVENCVISQYPASLISMGHGIKEKPIPIGKLHKSQLSNCWGLWEQHGLWPHFVWDPLVAELGIMRFLNGYGFSLYCQDVSGHNVCGHVRQLTSIEF